MALIGGLIGSSKEKEKGDLYDKSEEAILGSKS